jgi:hypothetical protein
MKTYSTSSLTSSAFLAMFLQELAKQLKNLTEQQVQDVLNGNSKLSLVVIEKQKSTQGSQPPTSESTEFEEITHYLKQLDSRESGLNYLQKNRLTKDYLQKLARFIDIPIQRTETKEKLLQRIIEATIGYRLNSQAIQGSLSNEPQNART